MCSLNRHHSFRKRDMRHLPWLLAVLLFAPSVAAQQSTSAGPIIHSSGAVFAVPTPSFETNPDLSYKVAFELAGASSSPDRLNPSLNTVARFLNMHAQGGVPQDRVQAAVVVHGAAAWELLNDEGYRARHGVDNPNAALIRELVRAGTKVILCGQTAASRGISHDGLVDGVQVALSAMTAFAMLQEQGFRVNPW